MPKFHWFVDGKPLCNRKTSGYSAHTQNDVTCRSCKQAIRLMDILEDKVMSQFDHSSGYCQDIVGGERINWWDHSQAVMHGPSLEKIMIWLTETLYNGQGVIALGTTDDGSIGVWYPFREGDEQQKAIGAGGDAFEALYSAIPTDWSDKDAAEQGHKADLPSAIDYEKLMNDPDYIEMINQH